MSAEIKIDPAEALRRIITNAAAVHRHERKRRGYKLEPFWCRIGSITHYGSTYSAHLCTSHGFNADTGEAL